MARRRCNRSNMLPSIRRFDDPELFHQGGEAVKVNSPRELHKFRIAAKKLRYTIQLLEPVLNGASRERLSR